MMCWFSIGNTNNAAFAIKKSAPGPLDAYSEGGDSSKTGHYHTANWHWDGYF